MINNEVGVTESTQLATEIGDVIEQMRAPKLNHDELHDELRGYYEISINEQLNTEDVKRLFPRLQNIKSRVAYICNQTMHAYKARKTALEIFMSMLIKEADSTLYKNKEAREGYAVEKLRDLMVEVQIYEFLKDNSEMCLKNLNDMTNVISRQVTVMQIEVQLGEMARPSYHGSEDTEESSSSDKGTWSEDENDSIDELLVN